MEAVGELLLVGLVATSVMDAGAGGGARASTAARAWTLDSRIQDDVHGDTTPRLTRVMFALTDIGSPQALAPVIPVVAGLLWWRRRRNAAIVWLIATGGAGVLVYGAEIAFPADSAGLAVGFVHEASYSFPSGHSAFAVVVYGMLSISACGGCGGIGSGPCCWWRQAR